MSHNPGNALKKMFLFFTLFGLLFLGVGIYSFVNAYQFVNDPAVLKTSGTVVELVPRRSTSSNNSGSVTYAPVISFTKADGTTHTFESNGSSNPPSYSVGQSVGIMYKGAEYKLDSFEGTYLSPVIFSVIGLVISAIGAGGLFFQGRRTKKLNN